MTLLLVDLGFEAVEVRKALAQDAPDEAVVAYAKARGSTLVTHDRGCARRALLGDVRHLWLRTREAQDRDRMRAAMPEVLQAFDDGSIRVSLFLNVLRRLP